MLRKAFTIVTCCALTHTSSSAHITIVDYADFQIVQRSIGSDSADIRVHVLGERSAIDSIQCAIVEYAGANQVVGWITLAWNGESDSASAPIRVPQGGWYRLAARALDSCGSVIASDSGSARWAVGVNVLCIGQSNMVGNGSIHVYTPVTALFAGLYGNDNRWKTPADPYDSLGSPAEIDYDSWVGASMVPALVNALSTSLPGVPIGIVPAAKGATALCGTDGGCWSYRSETDHADSATLYGNSLHNARKTGGVEVIVMHQGETDATDSRSREEYLAALRLMHAHYREDLYDSVPLFICQLARAASTDRNRTDTTMQAVRSAQLDAARDTGVYLAALCIDIGLRDGDHYVKDGYDTIGGRVAQAIACRFGAATHYRGPSIDSAFYKSASRDTIVLSIRHRGGSDITPQSGITGFEVFDDEAAVSIRSVYRTAPDTITIALRNAIRQSGTIRYLYGKSPDISGCVRDNSSLSLPLEPTAEPLAIVRKDATRKTPKAAPARRSRAKSPVKQFTLDGRRVDDSVRHSAVLRLNVRKTAP